MHIEADEATVDASTMIALDLEERQDRLRIGLLSELWHFWMSPIMRKKGNLQSSALPRLPLADSADSLIGHFWLLWADKVALANGNGRTLRRVVIRLLLPRFALIGLWQVLDAFCNFLQPIIIAAIVRDLRLGSFDNLGWDFALAVLLAVATMGGAAAIQQVLWGGARIGMRAKIALSAAVYSKTLHLSNAALLSTSAGAATNLVAIDVQRLEQSFTFFHTLWYTPLCVIILGVVLGVFVTGVATIPGLVFLVTLFFTQRAVGFKIAGMRAQIVSLTDKRVKMMHDVLAGSETLKVYAWENALARRVITLRAAEERSIWRSLTMFSTLEALIFFAPGLATFIILLTRYALDQARGTEGLEIEQAFSVLGLSNVLVKQLNMFPRAVKSFDEAQVSFRRVERFLLQEEAGDSSHQIGRTSAAEESLESASPTTACAMGEPTVVRVENATTTWAHAADANMKGTLARGELTAGGYTPGRAMTTSCMPFSIHNLTLCVAPGQLCLLMGEVGSGKSSLLQLLLGEMTLQSGRVCVCRDHGIGYVPQASWIVNGSVRENIILGRIYDEQWYAEVVTSCALEPDFKTFGEGDRTEIGERGVTVSGGQKARISLARALYGKPSLLLLDDPLSAVDVHVAQHLVAHALLKVARHKLGSAVVLASHQLQFVNELADEVIVLSHGHVIAKGPPEAIAATELVHAASNDMCDAGGADANDKGGCGAAPDASHDDATKDTPQEGSKVAAAAGETLQGAGTHNGDQRSQVTARGQSMVRQPTMALRMSASRRKSESSAAEMGRGNKLYEALFFYTGHLGYLGCLLILLTFVGLASSRALADWSLGLWIKKGQQAEGALLYGSLTAFTVCLGCAYALAFTQVIGAASRIHSVVLSRVLYAPKSFFDTTPLGLIINIFSKDMDTLDELLPIALTGFIKCLTIVSTAILVAAIAAPTALVIMPLIFLLFRRLAHFFQLTAGELKRIEKASIGPLFSLYTEALQGVTSIRAFGLQGTFKALLVERLDLNHTAHFLWTASQRWFAVRLDVLTACITLTVALSILLFRYHLEPSIAALALTYIIQTTSLFQWGFRMWAEVRNHFVSVERVLTYTKLPQEPPRVAAGDAQLIEGAWPQLGAIHFESVQMAYRPGLPLVLDRVDFAITGGIKAAVVGRSGAGKSSLTVALLRLAPLSAGVIKIDGVDISTLGLQLLRRSITFIQQDAILFAGTIRSNLDTFGEHTDQEVMSALAQVDWPRISRSSEGVCKEVAEGGANLSAGTRQLLMLARALLRGASILVLDEATANVDFQTDAVIQSVVRSKFPHATVLTIAHRLDTIIDYDLLLVMVAGRVVEAGQPSELLMTPDSLFASLVGTGPNGERLRASAHAAASRGHAEPDGSMTDAKIMPANRMHDRQQT